jgi:hypothetical protein
MPTTPTVPISCRVTAEAKKALADHAVLTGWSQSQLVERLVLNLRASWLDRLTDGQRQRYENQTMSRAEYVEIVGRAREKREPEPAKPNGAPNGMEQQVAGLGTPNGTLQQLLGGYSMVPPNE